MCHRNMAPLCRCEQVWASDVTTVMTYDYEIRIILLLVLLSYEISELRETGLQKLRKGIGVFHYIG